MSGDNCGDWLISSQGYFFSVMTNNDNKQIEKKVPEKRLKGEIELEKNVQLIYDIHSNLFDINEFPNGEPYLGFTDKNEEKRFFDACDYVIKRMKELFDDEFIVNEEDKEAIKNRSRPNS